ncbi:MAG: response regulator transcription factor [Nevskiales bacterium]
MTTHYLIIDDDETFCSVLQRAFSRRGYEASVAHNIEQALQQARSKPPSHVVLDLKLGNESGLDLLEPLNKLQPDACILLLTGYASIPTAVEAMRRGAINYLPKPADADQILAAFDPDSSQAIDAAPEPPSLRRLEWEHIQRVLAENNGNISASARALGMHRRTLQRKLQKRPTQK